MIYDLDDIDISYRIYQAWLAYIPLALSDLQKAYPDLNVEDVPDEQFRLLPNGAGEIFVRIRRKELKMLVPKDEFSIKV